MSAPQSRTACTGCRSRDHSYLPWNGNWDDPKAGHNMGNINGLQAFAFDFVSVGPDGKGAVGQKILAARPGKVVVAVS